MAFRGSDALGMVRYDFRLHDDGRITGRIQSVDLVLLHRNDPRVPPTFLPPSGEETDLYLRLSDGTAARRSVRDDSDDVIALAPRPEVAGCDPLWAEAHVGRELIDLGGE
jgi:hypothetical protein